MPQLWTCSYDEQPISLNGQQHPGAFFRVDTHHAITCIGDLLNLLLDHGNGSWSALVVANEGGWVDCSPNTLIQDLVCTNEDTLAVWGQHNVPLDDVYVLLRRNQDQNIQG